MATQQRVFDLNSQLWSPAHPTGPFFRDIQIEHRLQVGGSCVSTGLSLLTKEEPATVRGSVNTQDPVSWSAYLQRHGMQLAYCNTDFRRLKHYVAELLALDDLFCISTYSPSDPNEIGEEPDDSGWVCGSHFVVLSRGTVYDTRWSRPVPLAGYSGVDCYVKRVFRVVGVKCPPAL